LKAEVQRLVEENHQLRRAMGGCLGDTINKVASERADRLKQKTSHFDKTGKLKEELEAKVTMARDTAVKEANLKSAQSLRELRQSKLKVTHLTATITGLRGELSAARTGRADLQLEMQESRDAARTEEQRLRDLTSDFEIEIDASTSWEIASSSLRVSSRRPPLGLAPGSSPAPTHLNRLKALAAAVGLRPGYASVSP
jgi:hypothetical protein